MTLKSELIPHLDCLPVGGLLEKSLAGFHPLGLCIETRYIVSQSQL